MVLGFAFRHKWLAGVQSEHLDGEERGLKWLAVAVGGAGQAAE